MLSASSCIKAGIASVCSGDDLELVCAIQGRVLGWSVNFTNTTMLENTGSLTDSLSPTFPAHIVTIHSIVFNFSRISPQNSQPLVSKLLITPNETNGSSILNGTLVTCSDRETGNSSSVQVKVLSNYRSDSVPGKIAIYIATMIM